MSIVLYQFPISHYCEKIRWALDYKGLDYQVKNLLPGLHLRKTRKMAAKTYVPILEHNGNLVQNSHVILDYLDEQFPEKSLSTTDPALRQEMFEWEKFLDVEVGVHVRRYCYHILLDHPDIVVPFFTKDGPFWAPVFFKLFFPKLEPMMRKVMQIDEAGAQESERRIEAALDKINARLQGREFLVGDRFSRVDLTAAALLAPLFMPPQYGLDWPERDKVPERLRLMMERNQSKLAFAEKWYRDYRP